MPGQGMLAVIQRRPLNNKTLQGPKRMTNKNITLTKTKKDDLNAFFNFSLTKKQII